MAETYVVSAIYHFNYCNMNDNDKDFTPQQSLQLIRSMIETTKLSISDNSHFFLLWGYATMIGCLLQYYLLAVANYKHHYYAWFVTPAALLVHIVFLVKQGKRATVKTFISEANAYVWSIVGFSFLALAFVFTKIGWQYSHPFYILLYSIGTYISGSLLKFNPMRVGGGVCLALVAVAPYLEYPYQILLSGLAILISYIIPGHLLRIHYRKHNA